MWAKRRAARIKVALYGPEPKKPQLEILEGKMQALALAFQGLGTSAAEAAKTFADFAKTLETQRLAAAMHANMLAESSAPRSAFENLRISLQNRMAQQINSSLEEMLLGGHTLGIGRAAENYQRQRSSAEQFAYLYGGAVQMTAEQQQRNDIIAAGRRMGRGNRVFADEIAQIIDYESLDLSDMESRVYSYMGIDLVENANVPRDQMIVLDSVPLRRMELEPREIRLPRPLPREEWREPVDYTNPHRHRPDNNSQIRGFRRRGR